MERGESDVNNEALNGQIAAIRCANAAVLLSSLKSFPLHRKDEEKELLIREFGDLKLRLVRERIKSRRIKLFGVTELALLVVLVLFVSTLCLIAALQYF